MLFYVDAQFRHHIAMNGPIESKNGLSSSSQYNQVGGDEGVMRVNIESLSDSYESAVDFFENHTSFVVDHFPKLKVDKYGNKQDHVPASYMFSMAAGLIFDKMVACGINPYRKALIPSGDGYKFGIILDEEAIKDGVEVRYNMMGRMRKNNTKKMILIKYRVSFFSKSMKRETGYIDMNAVWVDR